MKAGMAFDVLSEEVIRRATKQSEKTATMAKNDNAPVISDEMRQVAWSLGLDPVKLTVQTALNSNEKTKGEFVRLGINRENGSLHTVSYPFDPAPTPDLFKAGRVPYTPGPPTSGGKGLGDIGNRGGAGNGARADDVAAISITGATPKRMTQATVSDVQSIMAVAKQLGIAPALLAERMGMTGSFSDDE